MKKTLTVSAQNLGYSFEGDPELNLPEYPRYIRELVAVPYGQNSVLYEGVRDIQVLSGRSARTFIPRLLAALDGSRNLADLCALFPRVPAQSLRDALALLYSRGLLENGAEQAVDESLMPLASFAGRYNDVTRVNESRHQALDRLAQTRVALIGQAADHLSYALDQQGFAAVERVDRTDQLQQGNYQLVVAVMVGDSPQTAALMRAAHDQGIWVLHGHIGRDEIEIGPLIMPEVSGCYDCFRQRKSVPAGSLDQGLDPAANYDVGFWAGVMAQHAVNLISRVGIVKLYNTCRVHKRTDLGPMYDKIQLARLPGCRRCGLESAGPDLNHPDSKVWILHHAPHVMTCKALRSPRDHQIHYAASNLELTMAAPDPRYGAEQVVLEQSDDLTQAPVWSAEPQQRERLDQNLLAHLLQLSAGYQAQGEGRRRIAPSGGGLGSARLFVVVRKLPGVAAGVYHYFGYHHVLERVGHVEDGLLAGALGCATDQLPPIVVVGTTDMRKVREKYDEFAFRLGMKDSGVARQYIQEVADSCGVECTEYADIRDQAMAHALQLATAGNRNMVTFAVGLGALRVEGEAPDMSLHHYHTCDSLIAMCGQLGASRQLPESPPLPKVPPHPLNHLRSMMLNRRSHRRFGDESLSSEVITALMRLAQHADQRRTSSGGLAVKLALWAAVREGNEQLTPGVYQWSELTQQLLPVRDGCTKDELMATTQQHGYAEAPVSFFVTGNFQHAIEQFGPRGYREILSRAGTMMARMQLAAMSWGAVGSMWGGIAEEGVGDLVGGDRYRQCPVFAASFGMPADE